MHNLDQLRAANAFKAAKATDRASVAKLPSMILTNGLLATLAFACEAGKDPREKMKAAADSLAQHLAEPMPALSEAKDGATLANMLATGDALTLQRATAEALAYLVYLKRYAPKKEKD